MTFTFYRLGKMEFWDAIFYGVAQFAGATAGVAIASALLLGETISRCLAVA
jgi:aquaporin Z